MIVPGSAFIPSNGGSSSSNVPAAIGLSASTLLTIADLNCNLIRRITWPTTDMGLNAFGVEARVLVPVHNSGVWSWELYDYSLNHLATSPVNDPNYVMGTWNDPSAFGLSYGFWGILGTAPGPIQIYDGDLNLLNTIAGSFFGFDVVVGNRAVTTPYYRDLPSITPNLVTTGTLSATSSTSASVMYVVMDDNPSIPRYNVHAITIAPGGFADAVTLYNSDPSNTASISAIDSNNFASMSTNGNISEGINVITGGPAHFPFHFMYIAPITSLR